MASLLLALVATVLFASLPGPSRAQSTCTAAQWKAAGRLVADISRCEAKAASKGLVPDPACAAKAEGRFARRIAKAEARGDCAVSGNQSQLGELTDRHAERLRALLDTARASSCCDLDGLCTNTSAEACIGFGEAPGPAGTSCSGTGTCRADPTPGRCCQLLFGLCLGGPIPEATCRLAGGVAVENALCGEDGVCAEAP